MKDLIKFNCNDFVWVKLTDRGRAILEEQHQDLLRRCGPNARGVIGDHAKLEEREDGFSRWQLWDLMRHFGSFFGMGIHAAPFELNILIETDE